MKKPTKTILKTFVPISAVAAVFGLAATDAHAQPVFNYNFPASWSSGTAVTDTSSAGNNGTAGLSMKLDTANVPPGAAAGTDSINTTKGHIYTTADQLLSNSAIWGGGGFSESIWFNWGGSNSTSFSGIQKLIDYAGTESLQLVTSSNQTATLEMVMDSGDTSGTSVEVNVGSTSITSSNWYNVTFTYTKLSLVGGDLSGTASLYVNGSLISSTPGAIKGVYGDSLDRPIGVGGFGYPSTTLIPFDGDIYSASVSFIPEPTTLALGGLGGLGIMMIRRRRKA